MTLDIAIKTMLDAQSKLRTKEGINSPPFMSEQMMRLAQATGAAEVHLAELEKDYEIQVARQLHRFLVTEGTSATNAEKRVKIELGEKKGQLTYLSRLVSSAWKQISTIQSRYNHLQKESVGQI
jgi:hypothetical protein